MEKYFFILVILSIISFLYLKLAVKFKIIDKPNHRSSHSKITVRGGGIIFPIAILLFFFFNDYQYPYFVLGVFLISVVSFLDDIYTLSSKIRFPFQVLAILLILYEIGLPLEPVYLFAISLIIGVGIINMFNFMDGINGITGLYSISVISGLYIINNKEQIVNSELIFYVFIALIVFGFYNFRKKALFFAGDIGSISIGMFIFFVGFYLSYQLSSPLIILLVIVYGADACTTLLYRKFFTKESVFEPHRHHIYQKMVDVKKLSHIKVSLFYTILQFVVNFVVINTYQLELQKQYAVLVVSFLLFLLIYIYLFKKLKV